MFKTIEKSATKIITAYWIFKPSEKSTLFPSKCLERKCSCPKNLESWSWISRDEKLEIFPLSLVQIPRVSLGKSGLVRTDPKLAAGGCIALFLDHNPAAFSNVNPGR